MTNTTPNDDDAFAALLRLTEKMGNHPVEDYFADVCLLGRFIGLHGVCEREKSDD